ncbi:hypothetical protein CERSUDRAFT_126893 [Gelatoporia subvermispora B]|uniref:Uncharacterized protein n=1 Tax=Ceriporiopsis subvermispora (strain B) TaxID=914234 RepID=M2R1U1_CERS8|nr:hypothetical protein CERSUDRAFT_126893 [Gelatoporia subvermispora B]
MMAFPLDEAVIVATVIEAMLYGFSILLFGLTVQILLKHSWRTNPHRRLMLGVSVLLFMLSTMHMGAVIKLLLNGLIIDSNKFPGGTIGYFKQPSVFPYVFKSAIYIAQTLTGDAILIYRCYMLWRSWWIVALPILMWFAVFVTGTGAVAFCVLTNVTGGVHKGVYTTMLDTWITSFYSFTLATNIITTSILAYKIWVVNRRAARFRQGSLMHIARIIIDAGALYSVSLILSLIAFAIRSNAHVLVDAVTQVIAISFYMILVRASKASSHLGLSSAPKGAVGTVRPSSIWDSTSSSQQYPMNTMPIHISKVVEHDTNYHITIDTTKEVSRDGREKIQEPGMDIERQTVPSPMYT